MITPAPTFATPGCDPRHPAPVIDGVTEIRCERKALQVIAAERCLQTQATGCSCSRQASRETVEYARTQTEPPFHEERRVRLSDLYRAERRDLAQRVEQMIASGKTRSEIGLALGLFPNQVEALRMWARRSLRKCARHGCQSQIRADNASGYCEDHRDKNGPARERRRLGIRAADTHPCAVEYCGRWIAAHKAYCHKHAGRAEAT